MIASGVARRAATGRERVTTLDAWGGKKRLPWSI